MKYVLLAKSFFFFWDEGEWLENPSRHREQEG